MAVKVIPIMTEITTAETLAEKIERVQGNYFTFPILDVTIKYRRPDLLKLSLNNDLPAVMAATIIESYKEALGGVDLAEYQAKLKDRKVEPDTNLLEDMAKKGYGLLAQLCVSHKILDVPQSDPVNNVISWKDIPEEDAMAFLVHVINSIQTVKTKDGGEMSYDDITNFPEEKRVTKRGNARTDGKAVRIPPA